jgi:hypothetical protein
MYMENNFILMEKMNVSAEGYNLDSGIATLVPGLEGGRG